MKIKYVFIFFFMLYQSQSSSQHLSFDKVKDSINAIILKEDIPGISLAIIDEKKSLFWSGGFGMANIENGIPMSENSLLYTASVSKNFIALAVLKLVEDRKVSLKDPIKEIIPEINFQNPWKDSKPITLEMLLEHTTGFDDTRYNNFIGKDNEILPLETLLNTYPNALHSRWKPGIMFSYSNLNYTMAGYIIERLSGLPFEEYIRQNILTPLKMNQTKLEGFTTKFDSLAMPYGYDFVKQESVPFFNNGGVGKNFMQRPASFVITSSKDMLKYLNFYLTLNENDSSIVKTSAIDRMENGETGYDSKLKLDGRYGLGNKPGLRDIRLFGHNGVAWNQAFFMYNRDENIGYYVATNCSYPIPEVRRLLNAFLLQDFKFDKIREYTSSSIAIPFEGFYETVTSRNEILLFFDKMRYAGNLKVENDTIYFDGGLKQRKYKAFKGSDKKRIALNRVDKEFVKQRNMASAGLMLDDNDEQLVVWDSGNAMVYFKRTTPFIHYFKKTSLFGSIAILFLSSLIILIKSIVLAIIKKKVRFSLLNSLIITISVALCIMIRVAIPNNPFELIALGSINSKTISFFLLSILLPLISLLFFINLFKRVYKRKPLKHKLIYSLVCYAILYLNIFMLHNGFVGLQFWNY